MTLLNKMCGKSDGQQKWKDICNKKNFENTKFHQIDKSFAKHKK